MSDYHIYILDSGGHVRLRHDFQGRDDVTALDESKKYWTQSAVEIWQGARRVALIDQGGSAPILETAPKAGPIHGS